MKHHAIVFTGGKGPDSIPPDIFPLSPPYICAADSGLDIARRFGLNVDYAIGDFDSLEDDSLLVSVNHRRLPSEKDISDTEALLRHLEEMGICEYTLIGGGEGRFDHLLHLFSLFTRYGTPARWLTAREDMVRINSEMHLDIVPGSTVSILPGTIGGTSQVTCSALRWPLDSFLVDTTHMSLSNIAMNSPLSLSVKGEPVFVSVPVS
ncbi:MAG: thiamine diphosphokinase [Sphaerochaetaceae bacterium]|nr:thiamine diphosphokinase [Sphaerochaetaceae bacterium]